MPVQPVDISSAPENVRQTYERVQEMFGTTPVPPPFLVYAHVEPFLRDFYMNFKKFVWSPGHLDERQKAALALATAAYAKCGPWLDWSTHRCLQCGFTAGQILEIQAVVATNAMYNTFFKFRELSGSAIFEGMGVGLRAHTFSQISLDESLIELINVAISDLNACRPCTSGHVDKGRKLGLSNEQLLECVQCTATMYAGCQFLSSAALTGELQ